MVRKLSYILLATITAEFIYCFFFLKPFSPGEALQERFGVFSFLCLTTIVLLGTPLSLLIAFKTRNEITPQISGSSERLALVIFGAMAICIGICLLLFLPGGLFSHDPPALEMVVPGSIGALLMIWRGISMFRSGISGNEQTIDDGNPTQK